MDGIQVRRTAVSDDWRFSIDDWKPKQSAISIQSRTLGIPPQNFLWLSADGRVLSAIFHSSIFNHQSSIFSYIVPRYIIRFDSADAKLIYS